MTNEVLDRALSLFSDKPIRTGDLTGAAQRIGLEERTAWDAFQALERAQLIRCVHVPHKKVSTISVTAWIRTNKPKEESVSGETKRAAKQHAGGGR